MQASTVREHEMMAVTALIDEKAYLHEQKLQLKKNCRDEKARLDKELERIRKRNEEMQKAEAAEVLGQIDKEFEEEHQKLLDQRKTIAEQNRVTMNA